jgi:CheY-like chemotaxis protein
MGTKNSGQADSLSPEADKNQNDNNSNIFIFHKDNFFSMALATALDYKDDGYKTFQEPDTFIKALKEEQEPTHVIICEDRIDQLRLLLENVFTIPKELPQLHLLSFLKQATLMKCLENNFPQLQNLFNLSIIQYYQLPKLPREIKSTLDSGSKIDSSCEKISNIRANIAKSAAEREDRDLRHHMGNRSAASRILNGAIRSGDYYLKKFGAIAESTYKQLLPKLEKLKDNGEEKRLFNEIQTFIKAAKDESRWIKAGNNWNKIRGKIKKVLIIDDEKEMWEPVWKFIFGEDKVDLEENGAKGVENIRKSKYDLVLLDVNLKGQNENGIEILQRIKHEQFDMPVIMMTAYDHAELTKKCFRYGAYSYFVKELQHDRNSV